MQSGLESVKEALMDVSNRVYHYEAFEVADDYFVWSEDIEGNSLQGDNKKIYKVVQGTIDYFTKTENSSKIGEVEESLNSREISYRLNSVQYEDETGYIHYEWVFEVSV